MSHERIRYALFLVLGILATSVIMAVSASSAGGHAPGRASTPPLTSRPSPTGTPAAPTPSVRFFLGYFPVGRLDRKASLLIRLKWIRRNFRKTRHYSGRVIGSNAALHRK